MNRLMQIHIGSLIREELRRQGRTNAWLADKIGVTPRALQKIFNKTSIDTQQLSIICAALDRDLFHCYTEWLNSKRQAQNAPQSETQEDSPEHN